MTESRDRVVKAASVAHNGRKVHISLQRDYCAAAREALTIAKEDVQGLVQESPEDDDFAKERRSAYADVLNDLDARIRELMEPR